MKTESLANYTVNLLYPLNEETVRQEAAAKLVPALNLTHEIVLKMLSRPPGPLTKPTTFENAERVAHHFISVGVPVEVGSIVPKPVVFEQAPAIANLVTSSPVNSSSENPYEGIPNPYQSASATTTMPVLTSEAISASGAGLQASSPVLNVDGSIARQTRRGSLRNNLILLSVLPLLVLGAAISGYLYSSLPQTSFDLVDTGLDRFVTSQALSLHPEATSNGVFRSSLQTLINQKQYSLAMVDIEPAEGSSFKDTFVSAEPSTATAFNKDFDAFRDTPQGRVRDAVFSSNALGQGNEKVTIIWADVYQQKDGNRLIRFDNGSSIPDVAGDPGKKIFRYNVGWLRQDSQNAVLQHVFLIIGLLALGLLLTVAAAAWFANQLAKPIVALTQAADRISLGELETPVISKQNDELGDLAAAVERMRVSLKTAIERLRKRR